ncbi:DNA polymerase I [Candidatus Dependentiae bacterium]
MVKKRKFDPEKTIFLIDGSSFLYRAYYGVRPLHTSKGEPVQAVYSFCRMIRKLISKFGAKYIALVWDSKGKTTRHEMYEAYKATRQAAPSDIFDQKERILDIADKVGLLQVAQKGIEADDIIFSIAKDYRKKGYNIVLVTLDKDFGQMLDAQTFMYDSFRDVLIDVPKFEEKMGFEVAKLPFYFALLGDASDNIPGVRGIGKKGALELVNQFDSLEDVYENLDKVPRPRARKALEASKKEAFLSRKLFLLQYVKTDLKKQDFIFDPKHWVNARKIFQELEFKSLLKEIDKDKQLSAVVVKQKMEKLRKYDFVCVTSEKELKELCYKLKNCKAFACDTETDGLRPLDSNCLGISVCMKAGKSFYIPFGHKWDTAEISHEQLTKEQVINYLGPIFEDKKIGKYLHHAKFDMLVLYNMGIELKGLEFDTLIAARLVSESWQRNGLKKLSIKYFDEPMLTFDEVVKANKYKDFSYVPPELATLYAAADAHQTLKLTKVLKKELKQKKMQKVFDEIELPLIEILYEMEKVGIYVDASKLKKLGKKIAKELLTIEQKITGVVGIKYAGINLNSPKQVQELLFDHLKLPTQKRSAKGTGYSTDQEVLSKLAKIHPVPGLILKYRELSKLRNTYVDALPEYINPKTGRIHTTFNQTDVATGRLSSSDPNLQNIPADSSLYGMQIRQAFMPKKGNVFLSADYSQIELRVLAHLSGDKNLINAFLEDRDIHAETASRLFDTTFDKVTHEQRQIGKRINFSILYGMTPYGLSRDLGISLSEAKKYIDKYFAQYPKVSQWMEDTVEETKKNGYVTTFWSRRRYIPGIYEKNKNLYELARRVAVNTRAQGTAAEIMKKGMIDWVHAIAKKKLSAEILLQIHDELLITVPKKQLKEVEELTQKVLESVVDWKVSLKVTTRSGASWKDVTK